MGMRMLTCCKNYELLRTALQAYVAAGWGPRTIIIDNSPNRRLINDVPVNHALPDCLSMLYPAKKETH